LLSVNEEYNIKNKEQGCLMKYIRKTCPVCGNQFVVLESMEEKAIYCTLKCFLEAQDKMGDNETSSMPE
jgi:hypothetical protein